LQEKNERPFDIRGPNRYLSIHGHSGFSTYDGLGYPNEHMDFCIENGLDGWALTDHGHMNAFGHAQVYYEKLKKSGKNFRFIPGCEVYLHPSLDSWQVEYQAHKDKVEARKQEKRLAKELGEKNKRLIITTTDEDDETTGVGVIDAEDASFTIENEEETKSTSKYFNPLKRRHHLVVLPKNSEALPRLFHMVSRSYKEGFYGFPRIDYEMLREHSEGKHFVVSTACVGGTLSFEVFQEVQQLSFDELGPQLLDDPSVLSRVMTRIGNVWDKLEWAVGRGNAFLELQFNKLGAQHLTNRALIEFAKQTGQTDRLIVTSDSHYPRPDQWKQRELYKKLGWLNYQEINPDSLPKSVEELKCELYPKNARQVWEEFEKSASIHPFYLDHAQLVSDAIERPHDVAHNLIGEIKPDRTMKLPSYVIPEGKTAVKALIDECKKGLIVRGLADKPEYIERLKEELHVIKNKNFCEYFLTMKAILDTAREKMLLGCGRGSGGGSLVNYVLNITDIDPIKYNLLFARFLSEFREGVPDIDVDVGDREVLLGLLRDKFGYENIVPISNYNTFKLKTLVRDVGRFYGIPLEEVNEGLKSVERDVMRAIHKQGDDKNMFVLKYEDALEHCQPFREFMERHPELVEPIDVLFKQNKSLGRHAGGVIVSENVSERMPLIMARGEQQTPWVEGMNFKHLEEFGWIKFDLLGLETLRVIQRAIELVLTRREGIQNPTFEQIKEWYENNLSPSAVNMDDQKVYEYVYHEGRFCGIFQVVNAGAQRLFTRCKPRSIIDLAALTSIYRPGPLAAGVDKIYNDAKSDPNNINYHHPLIKKVLESTYNCIIFQEQIMSLCNVVAGFPQRECDQVRRALLKRTAAKAEAQKAEAVALENQFVEGSVKNGVDAKIARELFNKILYFSGYGFNLSHAAAYSIVSYQCAWLLTYFEEEWLCAYLESMSGDPKDRAKAANEIKGLGYNIVPIDINHATTSWTILPGKKFMPSFLSCKGVGEIAVHEMASKRPFKSMEEFLWDEDGNWRWSKFNKRAMESLVKIRAFESFDCVGEGKLFPSYQALHNVVVVNWDDLKKKLKTDPNRGPRRLRELTLESVGTPEWTSQQLVAFNIELLGSFDPSIIVSRDTADKLAKKGVKSVDELAEEGTDLYWFIVESSIPKKTKTGKQYLMIKAMGESGITRNMYCWNWDGSDLPMYSFCVAEIEKSDFGCSTRWRGLKRLA
jgi:DNA polymerase-3 subunit alpha